MDEKWNLASHTSGFKLFNKIIRRGGGTTFNTINNNSNNVQESQNGSSSNRGMSNINKGHFASAVLPVTEDTPPDMLTGTMCLWIIFPDNKKVKMAIERSTPMMDLLVQITSAHKLSPAAHILQPYGNHGVLPYKPSTPIGALDTLSVYVVPKMQIINNQSNKVALKQVSQPFEQTFRLQIQLPRNQLYVTRVCSRTTIDAVLAEVCQEKGFDQEKYSLRRPRQLDIPLSDSLTVADLKSSTIVLVSKKSPQPVQVSTDDIIMYQRTASVQSEKSVSSSQPPTKPKRKKAPAPKPPTTNQQKKDVEEEIVKNIQKKEKVEKSAVICHSRTSSDSSGYHEPSILSDSCPDSNNSLPDSLERRHKLGNDTNQLVSKSMLNLHCVGNNKLKNKSIDRETTLQHASSTMSLNGFRKKKAAPAPPISKLTSTVEESKDDLQPKSSTLPSNLSLSPEYSNCVFDRLEDIFNKMTGRTTNGKAQIEAQCVVKESKDTPENELIMADEEIDRIFNNATKDHSSLESGIEVETTNSTLYNLNNNEDISKLDLKCEPSKFYESKKNNTDVKETVQEDRKQLLENTSNFRHVEIEFVNQNVDSEKNNLYADTTESKFINKSFNVAEKPVVHSNFSEVDSSLIKNKFSVSLPPPPNEIRNNDEEILNWEYQLPAPPTFRDCFTSSSTINNNYRCGSTSPTEYGTMTIGEDLKQILYNPKEDCGNKFHEKCDNLYDTDSDKVTRSSVFSELTNIIEERKKGKINKVVKQHKKADFEIKSNLNNFKITAYDDEINFKKPVIIANYDVSSYESPLSKINNQKTSQDDNIINKSRSILRPVTVKRSMSTKLINSNKWSVNSFETDTMQFDLRKTSSELSINNLNEENTKAYIKPSGLQSVQVLKSILPKLSQSTGSVNKLIQESEEFCEKHYDNTFRKPSVEITTWDERPKCEISIKNDNDYVFGKRPINVQTKPFQFLEKFQESDKFHENFNGFNRNSKIKSPTKVYKNLEIETGNTKTFKDIILNKNDKQNNDKVLPVVRSIELKRPNFLKDEEIVPTAETYGVECLAKKFERNTYGRGEPKLLPGIITTNVNSSQKKYTSVVGITKDDRNCNSSKEDLIRMNVVEQAKLRSGGIMTSSQTVTQPTETLQTTNLASNCKIKWSKMDIGPETPLKTYNLPFSNNELQLQKQFPKKTVKPVENEFSKNIISSSAPEANIPPPPFSSVLRPVSERKLPKLLPPPAADPRDLLLESIRNFGGANNLKKIKSTMNR